jgi:hypothetical protein
MESVELAHGVSEARTWSQWSWVGGAEGYDLEGERTRAEWVGLDVGRWVGGAEGRD